MGPDAASWHLPEFSGPLPLELATLLTSLLPVWAFGLLLGYLLPRPSGGRSGRLTLLVASLSASLRSLLVGVHAAIIVREVWRHFFHPGTARGLARATVQWLCGNGWTFTWPVQHADSNAVKIEAAEASPERMDNWYVGEKDLAFFKYHAVEGGACDGASPWQLMMEKDLPGFVRYTSWRRTLPGGKTEYKSVTVSPNATAREFSDLYLDDDFRRNWDGMVYHHEVLEHGDFAHRQQVVRWKRRFPFAFLSDREYTIARREYIEDDGAIYGITKAIHGHPREAMSSSVVRMDVFWSMWCSRTVPDPWGGDAPACETVLLHHEQFKIPENLARFAVKHGMWSFVKKLASTVPLYVEARRKRVPPHADDPQAYGAGETPNPPSSLTAAHMRHCDSAMSLDGMAAGAGAKASWGGSECGSDDSARPGQGHAGGHAPAAGSRARRVRNVAAALVIGSVALALGVRGGAGAGSCASAQRRRPRRHALASHRLAEVPELLDE